MKSKGFTLIELLAVIVILAIIALIATPIVLGIIEDSKTNANKVSAQYIVDAVEKAYAIAYTSGVNAGSTPNLERVKASFEMSGAEWKTVDGKDTIETTDGSVVCEVGVVDSILKVDCPGFGGDNIVATMTIAS